MCVGKREKYKQEKYLETEGVVYNSASLVLTEGPLQSPEFYLCILGQSDHIVLMLYCMVFFF